MFLKNVPSCNSFLEQFSFFLKMQDISLTLFRMGFFGVVHGWGGGGAKRPPLSKICHTYPTVMKLGTVTPYPKKIQKVYEPRDTPLEFC